AGAAGPAPIARSIAGPILSPVWTAALRAWTDLILMGTTRIVRHPAARARATIDEQFPSAENTATQRGPGHNARPAAFWGTPTYWPTAQCRSCTLAYSHTLTCDGAGSIGR